MSGRIRKVVEVLLHVEDTPHRIALAFGLGVFLAFSPLLGLHTVLGLAIAFAFKLSRAAILIGVYVNNPWTLGPCYMAGTVFGCALLGVSTDGLAGIDFALQGMAFYRHLVEYLRPYLWPFLVGNTVMSVALGLLGYFVLRRVLERRKSRREAAAAG
jgi:uncharacterized protein (DUF2062 family)